MPRHVEMEVIEVEPVAFRPQHRAEGTAGRPVQPSQQAAIAPRSVPALKHRNPCAVFENEG